MNYKETFEILLRKGKKSLPEVIDIPDIPGMVFLRYEGPHSLVYIGKYFVCKHEFEDLSYWGKEVTQSWT